MNRRRAKLFIWAGGSVVCLNLWASEPHPDTSAHNQITFLHWDASQPSLSFSFHDVAGQTSTATTRGYSRPNEFGGKQPGITWQWGGPLEVPRESGLDCHVGLAWSRVLNKVGTVTLHAGYDDIFFYARGDGDSRAMNFFLFNPEKCQEIMLSIWPAKKSGDHWIELCGPVNDPAFKPELDFLNRLKSENGLAAAKSPDFNFCHDFETPK